MPRALTPSRLPGLLLCGLLAAPAAMAQTTLYRCTDAAGNLTVQNRPCPPGTTQRVQTVADVPSVPMPAPAPAPAAPPAGADAGPPPRVLDSAALPQRPAGDDAVAGEDRLPPPPLFRCTTHEGDSYLSEEQEQPPRYLPLRTVGLDGDPSAAAGQAHQVVHDQCARVPDGAACDAWRRYAREAESRWRFAHPDNAQRRRGEYERLARVVAESACGG